MTNEYQSVLASASGASQSASRMPVSLTSTPHALKLRNHDQRPGNGSKTEKRLVMRAVATLDTIWREAGRVRWGGVMSSNPEREEP